MTISWLIRLTCLLTLFIALFITLSIAVPLHAQEQTTAASEPTASETDSAAIDDPAEQKKTAAEQIEQQPEAENLKNRDLGAAFRSFQPSEEISADNAVPFPIDI
jgi:hypothetical protein